MSLLKSIDKECDSCGGQLEQWEGQFEEFEEVDIVERVFRIVRHRRKKCSCSCGCGPVTARGPARIAGSGYTLDFTTAVAVDTWAWHLPLERQSARMLLESFPIRGAQLWQQAELLARLLDDTHDTLPAP